jgi:outer membrane protein insertion porin family
VAARYGLTFDEVTLDEGQFFTGGQCDPRRAGRYLCDAIGERVTSSVGYSIIYDSLNNRLRPSGGHRVVLSQDFAGLGGDVRYIRTRFDADKYWNVGGGFIFSVGIEGGYVHPLEESRGPGIDKVRITDRFYLGEPQFRGFDIRGVGPRILRSSFTGSVATGDQAVVTDRDQIQDDALGGRAYYLGRAELEIPLGAGARELGLRPSIFVDVGALFNVTRPLPTVVFPQATNPDGTPMFNADGSPSLLPLVTPASTADGRPIYDNVYTPEGATAPQTRQTLCSTGFSATVDGPCEGTAVNVRANNTEQPFYEQFLGDTAKPRLSVGFGVNWNSPFGPLRIDVAKALITAEGDDPKLFTFNVGTQF